MGDVVDVVADVVVLLMLWGDVVDVVVDVVVLLMLWGMLLMLLLKLWCC